MKRFISVSILILSLTLIIFASDGFSADEKIKVAIVDLFKTINESEMGKKAKSDLEGLIKTKQASIEEKGKKIEALKSEIEKQSTVISPEAKKTKEEEMEKLVRDYQRIVSDSQAEVKKKEAELTGEILKQAREAINKIAQEGGYSLVLEKADGVVLYFSSSLDITDKVIKRLNESKQSEKKTETKPKSNKK
ncbi:MAG: OmpH family outer membrane protein [Thermodesulfovibrionales bacterium]|nr:OmpH family outer membrane protein [Thermodesulfovibrionales bacterium]